MESLYRTRDLNKNSWYESDYWYDNNEKYQIL